MSSDLRPVYYELALRDNGDTVIDTRWTDDAGTPYAISSAKAQVRATEASATALLTATTTLLGAPDYWVRFTFLGTAVATADFESLDPDTPAVWDCTLTRTTDGLILVSLAGNVRWNKGVSR